MIALNTRHIADLSVEVGAAIVVGRSESGMRRLIPILGGTIEGPGLNGRVQSGGVDYQLIRSDGFTALEARYVIELDDGARIYVENVGIRSGKPEVMARLLKGEAVDPAQVYFRTNPRFETESAAHSWMSSRLFVAAGIRRPDRVELSIYMVE